MAVLNIVKTDGKCAPEAKQEDLKLIRRCSFRVFQNDVLSEKSNKQNIKTQVVTN